MKAEEWKQDAKELGFKLNKLKKCPICKVKSLIISINGENSVLSYDCLKGDHMFTLKELAEESGRQDSRHYDNPDSSRESSALKAEDNYTKNLWYLQGFSDAEAMTIKRVLKIIDELIEERGGIGTRVDAYDIIREIKEEFNG